MTGAGTANGLLAAQDLRASLEAGVVSADLPLTGDQVQPSSIDLRLGAVAYRVRASFLPGAGHDVAARLDAMRMHALDLREGAVLERGCVYIVPLLERLALPPAMTAIANPKSSTGRLDVFARVITDRGLAFDRIRAGYTGPLYAEVAPRSFSVLARRGDRLVQLRLRAGPRRTSDAELKALHDTIRLVDPAPADIDIDNGLPVTVDVQGDGPGTVIGYRARKHAGLIDLARVGHYRMADFWEPLYAGDGGGLVLDPDDFYILASRERVKVPETHAAEMVAYDTLIGEFRVHYAGFFDPGFGDPKSDGEGSRAVLEVRSHEVPFVVDQGQTVGRLVYERLTAVPDILYGSGIGSHYQRQGLALSKHFARTAG
ncbi:MAG: 2'-deoxycytidine 5'-triphosphate deaminase [Rhodospirillaceae bacterium]|nr:2'-deoxycytidine 5'-triphosphate deaminase [Rhodospirillaceae bacterium]